MKMCKTYVPRHMISSSHVLVIIRDFLFQKKKLKQPVENDFIIETKKNF